MSFSFCLLTETSFHACYLVTHWMEAFCDTPEFKGIIVRGQQLSEDKRMLRESFHQNHQGETHLTHEAKQLLLRLYPDLSQTDQAMIERFGIPAHCATYHPATVFLDGNLNSPQAQAWLMNATAMWNNLFLFIFLDQMLAPWWIRLTDAKIINGHSAVLPHARGMYAIENIAITQRSEDFKKATGATVHYIDDGVDTGPIIRAERLTDPFRFHSLWDLKGYSFSVVFELLIRVAREMLSRPSTLPVGTSPSPGFVGPVFRSRDFTAEAQKKAEEGYRKMKAGVSA